MAARVALASAVSTKEWLNSVNLRPSSCLARLSARRMPAWRNISGPPALGIPPPLWIWRLETSVCTSEKSCSLQLQQIGNSSLLQVSHGLVQWEASFFPRLVLAGLKVSIPLSFSRSTNAARWQAMRIAEKRGRVGQLRRLFPGKADFRTANFMMTNLAKKVNGLTTQTCSGLLGDKGVVNHLSSLIPNRPR